MAGKILTAMTVLVFLILLVALGVASVLGFTPDTRDPDYGLGPVIRGGSARDDVLPERAS
jgi:hypothetical protein